MAPPGDPFAGRVVLGRLGAPHGLGGEMRLHLESDFPERLRAGRGVWLHPREGLPLPTRLRGARPLGRGVWGVSLEGIDGPEAASRFTGGLLSVAAADLPPLPEGEYYHHQLVGLAVLRPDGRRLGRLTRVLRTAANDVFVVQVDAGGEVLVPATRAAVREVDLRGGALHLADLPGLLDEG